MGYQVLGWRKSSKRQAAQSSLLVMSVVILRQLFLHLPYLLCVKRSPRPMKEFQWPGWFLFLLPSKFFSKDCFGWLDKVTCTWTGEWRQGSRMTWRSFFWSCLHERNYYVEFVLLLDFIRVWCHYPLGFSTLHVRVALSKGISSYFS